MDETVLSGESRDIVSDNISKFKEIFPEVITEDKIDFEKLKLILGEDIETDSERYAFTWPGKTQAIKESQKQSTGTLRPCKEESKNWDTTENLYIEGDNLEVLKLLQKSYYGKIKAIYIDPPYNTGKDFIYKDNYRDNLENYLKISGQMYESDLDSTHTHTNGIKVSTNTETQGRYHSNWLNMMYPRLKLARNLLSDDGVIFISIDDNEVENLKKICDEIFGVENFRNIIHSRRYDKNLNLQFVEEGLSSLNVGLEYILVYTKNTDTKLCPVYKESNEKRAKKGYWKGFWNNADRPTMRYDLFGVLPEEGQWKWQKEVAMEAVNNYEIYLNNFANKMSLEEYWNITGRNKRFLRRNFKGSGKNKGVEHWVAPSDRILRNSNWSDMLISKQNKVNVPFDNPKNFEVIQELIKLSGAKNNFILDFFSGSGTTAVASFLNNLQNNYNNHIILIQLPELANKNSRNYHEDFKNICEIGKERIRRAGDKIVEESGNKDLDIGFKVFKLDSSNLEKWDPDYNNLEQTLLTSQDNIKSDRTQEDLIYEIMLKYGIDLTLPIEKHETQKNTIYSIGFGALVICLDNNITKDIVSEILDITEDLDESRVVFKDNGFASDSDKTNIKEILKTNNVNEFITI